jgi:hypothetical protein
VADDHLVVQPQAAPGQKFRRALFLDFDGVLHPTGELPAGSTHFQWLPVLVELLAPWPDVLLVVHSTWRYDHADVEIRQLLGYLGAQFVGSVPRGPREQAIQWFLRMNPVISKHLVLDDAAREFTPTSGLNLVLCDPLLGVSDPQVQQRLAFWLMEGEHDQ